MRKRQKPVKSEVFIKRYYLSKKSSTKSIGRLSLNTRKKVIYFNLKAMKTVIFLISVQKYYTLKTLEISFQNRTSTCISSLQRNHKLTIRNNKTTHMTNIRIQPSQRSYREYFISYCYSSMFFIIFSSYALISSNFLQDIFYS